MRTAAVRRSSDAFEIPIHKEPFVHFVALGTAIFAGYALISDGEDRGRIVVTSGQQENLIATFDTSFANALNGLPEGQWMGQVESGFGLLWLF